MALIVKKFGGSSVADAKKIQNVCNVIAKTYDEGNDVVVVLSAQGDTTDDLIEKAQEITFKFPMSITLFPFCFICLFLN